MYLSEFMTLELSAVHRPQHPSRQAGQEDFMPPQLSPLCLAKLICLKSQVPPLFDLLLRHWRLKRRLLLRLPVFLPTFIPSCLPTNHRMVEWWASIMWGQTPGR